jgi:hypothetical protein
MSELSNKRVNPEQATAVLEKLFGPGERTVVLIVDQDQKIIDYSIKSLSEVIATLSLNGFSQIIQNEQEGTE